MRPPEPEVILLAGPTASGKSALALALAQRLGGVVVNADSMQIYRELPVLSARPSAEDEAAAPHRLYGIASAYAHFSVASWLGKALAELARCHAAGQTAIVTGGAGLCFKALTHGLSTMPAIPEPLRQRLRAERARVGAQAFFDAYAARDPDGAAQLNPGDTQRVLRAAEVLEASGRSIFAWRDADKAPPLAGRTVRRLVLMPQRSWLYARINARFDLMMAQGALDEARSFWASCPDPALPAARALGLPQLRAALSGDMPLDEAVEYAKRATRQYAKRQLTWFRNQMPDWPSLDPAAESNLIQAAFRVVLQRYD